MSKQVFNSKVPFSHEDFYSGYEGYTRAQNAVLESFNRAYPDYADRLAIVDLEALEHDRPAELARISKALNVDSIEVVVGKEIGAREMFSGYDQDGGSVAVVAGNALHNESDSTLSFQENVGQVGIFIHELAHAVDHFQGDLERHDDHENYFESYADSFRVAMRVLNDLGVPEIKEMIASYDNRQAIRGRDPYDNGQELKDTFMVAQARAEQLPELGLRDPFDLVYWKEAIDIADNVREKHIHQYDGGRPIEYDRYDRKVQLAIYNKSQQIIGSKVEDSALKDLPREDTIKHIKYIAEDMTANFFDKYDTSHLNEKGVLMWDIAYEARLEMNEWIHQRRSFIPEAERTLAGYAYLSGTGEFLDYQEPEYDITRF